MTAKKRKNARHRLSDTPITALGTEQHSFLAVAVLADKPAVMSTQWVLRHYGCGPCPLAAYNVSDDTSLCLSLSVF